MSQHVPRAASDDGGEVGSEADVLRGALEGWLEPPPEEAAAMEGPPSDQDGYEFEEREERIKEQLLEIEEQSTVSDAWAYAVIGLEDDDERREREHREMWEMCEREDREQELLQVHEVYKRASNRVFRRLKNLPEPPPGCHYTGDGEDDDEDVQDIIVQNCDPGEGEESAEEAGPHSPHAMGTLSDVLVHKASAQPARPSHRSVLRRLRRRRQPPPKPVPPAPLPLTHSASQPFTPAVCQSPPPLAPASSKAAGSRGSYQHTLPQPILAGT
eukprot:TRINITY_DN384_c0_g5_i1.p2 TRINITY_DN384_c0_g5~~TRINITY_DN384_c0_g5_i1.p2  ORF type:complete len:271 (+),score=95.62 TRINITY_DN384_c0_g5_i1:50-862(+)